MTKQRQAILDVVQNSCEHLSAEEIYEQVHRDLSGVSLGTVYRNLNLLSHEGLIRRVEVAGAPDRYDRNVVPHEHLRCVRCGRLIDCPIDLSFLRGRLEEEGMHVLDIQVYFNGYCDACFSKMKNETQNEEGEA